MGSWVSLIASIMIGGLVLVSFGRFSSEVSQDLFFDTLDNAAYGNLGEVAAIIEYDFSRIGLGINDPKQAVIDQADSTAIRFYLKNASGVIESIRYFWGDSTSAAATDNPRDRVLFRVVNGGANEPISAGLTDFKIKYYSALGTQTTNPDSIRTLEVNLAMESDIMYDTQYPKLFWHGKITPPGLVTR